MEINGITFKDYACAMANQAGGMSDEKICEVFGMEQPVWEDTKNQWVGKMAEMSHDDMKFYGEVFMNPKQGKFANVEGGQEGPEKVLEKYPKWSNHIKMQQHFAIADDVGIHVDFQKEYGISMTEYSQLGMHWGGIFRDAMNGGDNEKMQKLSKKQDKLMKKWKKHFKAMYKDQDAGIADDIDF
jgi:hypothetical protein